MVMASMAAAAAARRRRAERRQWVRATASARNLWKNRTPPSRPTAGPARACRAPPSPTNRTSMQRARSTAALPLPHHECHTAGPIRCRTRPADRTKRPSGPGISGHHNLIYEAGLFCQKHLLYTRGRAALLPHLHTLLVKVAFVFFRVCRSSNSPRRSGAARAPATAVARLLVVDWTRTHACSAAVPSDWLRRSLVSSSRAAPRAPPLLMQRRRAPATACPCAGAAGAGGCPCYLFGRLPRPPTDGCAISVWCVRADCGCPMPLSAAFGCFRAPCIFLLLVCYMPLASSVPRLRTRSRGTDCCILKVFESRKQGMHSRGHQRYDARLRSLLMFADSHCARTTPAPARQSDGAAICRR